MNHKEFVTWLQSATFERTPLRGTPTPFENFNPKAPIGERFTQATAVILSNAVKATLPDGALFQVRYREYILWAGTETERLDDKLSIEADPAQCIAWASNRPRITDADGDHALLQDREVDKLIQEFLPGLTVIDYNSLLPPIRSPGVKYGAYTAEAIWGSGQTPEAAIAQACQHISEEDAEKFRQDCKTAPMTDALIAEVESRGGNCSFVRLPDGRIGTVDEYDAELNH